MFGRVLVSAAVLALPLGLGGCLKGSPVPPVLDPPDWSSTTVGFFNQQVGNPATGWVTTVTVPSCIDFAGTSVEPLVSVSNGTLSKVGGVYTWTRAVSGTPAVAASGVFTADCIDHQGSHAHPVLAVTAAALP